MKRVNYLLSFIIALALALPGAHSANARTYFKNAFPVTIVDDQGNHVRITHQPKRIITLFAAQTEILFALGLESRVVGDASQYAEGATGIVDAAGKPRNFKYPSEWPSKLGRDYPVRSLQLPHVEGGFGTTPFNLETITSLHPDLIVAPYYKSQEQTFQKMKDAGFTVMFLNPANVRGVLHDIALLGAATGATKPAGIVVAEMKKQLATVKSRIARVRSRPRVYYEVDATNPAQPITAGPGTVIDEAIRVAGGKNVADSVTSCSGTQCYPALGLEALVQADPQIIVLSDAVYGTTPEKVKARGGWSTMTAVKTGKIFPLNPDLLSRFGPRVIIGMRDLAHVIHPEAFR